MPRKPKDDPSGLYQIVPHHKVHDFLEQGHEIASTFENAPHHAFYSVIVKLKESEGDKT